MPTRVQSTGKSQSSGTDTLTLTFPAVPTAGNLIVLMAINWNGGVFPTNAVTDSEGNIWVRAAVRGPQALTRCAIYYCEHIPSPVLATYTVTIAAETTNFCTACATEFSGFTGYNLLDVTATNDGTSTAPSTGTTATSAQASSLAVAVVGVAGAEASITVQSVSPAWTQEFEELSFTIIPGEGDSRSLTSTGTQSCAWTLASSQTWVACIAIFKTAGSALPTTSRLKQVTNSAITAMNLGDGLAFTRPVTNGNAILALFSYTNNGNIVTSVADSRGNSYMQIRRYTGTGNLTVDAWVAFNITGGTCTVTPTLSGGRTGYITLLECIGVEGIGSYSEASESGAATAHAATNVASTSSNALFVLGSTHGVSVGTEGDGFLRRAHQSNQWFVQTKSETSTAVEDGSWTSAGSVTAANLLVVLEGTATPGEGVPVITIAGVLTPLRRYTLNIVEVTNGRNTLTAEIISTDGTYRPAVDAEVIVYLNGDRAFAGTIDSTSEYGITGPFGVGIFTRVNVNDFNSLADKRYFKGSLAGGTLKSMLQTIVDDYLDDYGVTLHPAQATGPTLDAQTYDYRQVTEVLNDLSALSEYVWEIDYDKQLRMYSPGTIAAPFNVINNDGHAIGDITIDQEPRTGYANRIILRYGSGNQQIVDTFTGDGTTYSFDLSQPVVSAGQWVDNNGTQELMTFQGIGFDLAVQWLIYAPVSPGDPWTLQRRTSGVPDAPANGNVITVAYVAQFPVTIVVEDTGEQVAPVYVREKIIEKPDVFDKDVAQAMAEAELAIALERPTTAHYKTRQTGLKPGYTQTITVTRRAVNDTYLITEIRSYDSGDDDGTLIRDVTATQGTVLIPGWREVWKNFGSAGGSTAPVATP